MIVKEIKTIDEVIKCVPYEIKVLAKHRETSKTSDLIAFINTQLENPLFKFWIVYENDNIKGYCFGFLNITPGFKKIHVIRIFALSDEARNMLKNILDETALSFGIKKMSITVKRNIKAFSKKYQFKPVSVNMEREV
jgi:hypothetical protein